MSRFVAFLALFILAVTVELSTAGKFLIKELLFMYNFSFQN